jgi:hypothetical protein
MRPIPVKRGLMSGGGTSAWVSDNEKRQRRTARAERKLSCGIVLICGGDGKRRGLSRGLNK